MITEDEAKVIAEKISASMDEDDAFLFIVQSANKPKMEEFTLKSANFIEDTDFPETARNWLRSKYH